MILAEALDVRLAPPPADKKQLRQERDQHGVYEKILDKSGNWIGLLDVHDNMLVVRGQSENRESLLQRVFEQVGQAYHGGLWDGAGGITTTAGSPTLSSALRCRPEPEAKDLHVLLRR